MFASSNCRFCLRRANLELRRFFAFQSSSDPNNSRYKTTKTALITGTGLGGLVLAYYDLKKEKNNPESRSLLRTVGEKFNLYAAAKARKHRRKSVKNATAVVSAAAAEALSVVTPPATSNRERRFLEFASVEYDGQAFMTPMDFLEAVVQDTAVDERVERRVLSIGEAEKLLGTRGPRTKDYFRSLGQGGLISYTEYLFLLCILTKPQASFRVAFNMLDADGNQFIDKKEFLVMERIFANSRFSKKLLQGVQFEKHLKSTETGSDLFEEMNQLNEREKRCDTTLMRRFFGRRGRHVLTYEEFHKFMEDLQTEILEIEFNEFSRGQEVIKESDFARLLLRYAFAHRDAYLTYMKRVDEKIRDTMGITFEQYRQFCLFLTNLDDFAMAVKLYTFRDLPVTQSEFARAAKISTGFALEPHVVDTVFKIFDINEDARLSYGEFISVMRDRLHRGAKRIGHRNDWQLFKRCMREEMKRY